MLSNIVCYHRKLQLWDEGVHGMKGAIWKKDESVLKLWIEKLRLSTTTVMENETDLKEEKIARSLTDYPLANSKCQVHECNFTQAASCA
jgi:hypothetical protein